MPKKFEEFFSSFRKKKPSTVDRDELEKDLATGVIDYQKYCKPAQEKTDIENIPKIIEWLKEKYGLEITVLRKKLNLKYRLYPVPDDLFAAKMLKKLEKEIIKFPPVLFKKLDIKEIFIAGKIRDDYRDLWGSIRVGSTEMYLSDMWAFHHEIFHRIDAQMGGMESASGAIDIASWKYYRNGHRQNEEWLKLDPDLYKKVKAVRDARTSTEQRDHNMHYGIFEDEEQAMYCRRLFQSNSAERVTYLTSEELNSKAGKVKMAKIKEWLLKWSDGLFDEKYWKDLEAGKVKEDYWDKRLKKKQAR
jgi:hypothetical protein